MEIKKFLKKELKEAAVSQVDIERSPSTTTIIIYSAKPGVIIGRGGQGIEELKKKGRRECLKNTKATLNIRLITNLSEDVPSPAEDYYQYIEITPVGITDSDITSVQFEFSVNKSWLANGNYDEKTVKLNRYLGNSFYELQTDLISDKGKEISYKSISTGFSYYIITAEEKSVQTIEPDIGSSSEITSSQTNASSGDLAGMAIKWADNQETSEQSEMQSPENTNPIETLKSGISKYRVYLIIVAGIVVVILITQFIKITMVRKDLKKPVKKRNAKHRQKNQEADNLPVDNEQK